MTVLLWGKGEWGTGKEIRVGELRVIDFEAWEKGFSTTRSSIRERPGDRYHFLAEKPRSFSVDLGWRRAIVHPDYLISLMWKFVRCVSWSFVSERRVWRLWRRKRSRGGYGHLTLTLGTWKIPSSPLYVTSKELKRKSVNEPPSKLTVADLLQLLIPWARASNRNLFQEVKMRKWYFFRSWGSQELVGS